VNPKPRNGTWKMKGQSQKRQVKSLEANKGDLGRNPGGSMLCVINRTSGKENPIQCTTELMVQLVARPNMLEAYKKVVANKGAPGIDNVTTEQLREHLFQHWEEVKEDLLKGTYRPQAVRRVEIPKADGGKRKLGIPTVMDRLIQQALHQVLSPIFEKTFSENSYGFRPKRSAQQAIMKAKQYIKGGLRWIVDMDLEKFFDKVNHDILIDRIRRKVRDPTVLTLIRRYLKSGVMEDGVVSNNEEGTPQGGPISPLLSNIMLTDLDRELQRRGHAFCRYADDCNIYVRSERAAERVMSSITSFVETKLKLKVNREKSKVDRPWRRKFLGFSFTSHLNTKIRVHGKSVQKLKGKIKDLCRIGRGWNQTRFIQKKINPVIRGWVNYFKIADTYTYAKDLDAWIRRRLRTLLWRQWSQAKVRKRKLLARGIDPQKAFMAAYSSKGAWRMCGFTTIATAIPATEFQEQGLISMYRKVRYDKG
jgi:RNA-directed DNA polymerase